ncbi:MAG: TonB family protein, partial [Gammaproteobacteria bacterium]|nr:TonB family protein [Gammaproteobacteria bacterium]
PKPEPKPKKPEPVLEPMDVEPEMEEPVRVAKNTGQLTQGSNVEAADFPTALNYWATLVKRKVDRNWRVPPGISLDAAETKIRVGFWVSRNGEVLDTPTILGDVPDRALGQSCLQAIKNALPLPPFPDGFTEPEQYVTYVFTLTR